MIPQITVDEVAVDRYLSQGRKALAGMVDAFAKELEERVARESGSASSKLPGVWSIGKDRRDTVVGTDYLPAGFLARGTQAHGPVHAPRLAFSVKGRFVQPMFVAGIRADPFHERAMDAVAHDAGDIISRLIAQVVA